MKPLLSCALLPLLWSATASSASLPTYWGIVGSVPIVPTGSSRDGKNPFALGNIIGYGLGFEFGQYFGPKFGYNIRLVSTELDNKKHRYPVSPDVLAYMVELNHAYLSGGVNYKYPKYDVVFNANITIGRYNSGFTVWTPVPFEDGDGYWGGTYLRDDVGVLGFELGVTKKLKWGLQANVFYHYSRLPKDDSGIKDLHYRLLDASKADISSVQFAGFGIKYLWGRGR